MRERLKKLNNDLVIALQTNNHKQVNRLVGEIEYEKDKESLMRWVWYR